jgi:hypothetical protein
MWMIQLFNQPGVFRVGLVTLLLTVLLIAYRAFRDQCSSER